jgi:hypothetical protein
VLALSCLNLVKRVAIAGIVDHTRMVVTSPLRYADRKSPTVVDTISQITDKSNHPLWGCKMRFRHFTINTCGSYLTRCCRLASCRQNPITE